MPLFLQAEPGALTQRRVLANTGKPGPQGLDLSKQLTCNTAQPPSPATSTFSSSSSSSSCTTIAKSAFQDPYATRFARTKLLLEASFGLSMLEAWEQAMIVGVLLLVLVLLGFGLYQLPSSVLFILQRLRYFASGSSGSQLLAV